VLEDVELLQNITLATRAAVSALVESQTDAEGRVSMLSKLNFLNIGKKSPWIETLRSMGYPQVDPVALKPCLNT